MREIAKWWEGGYRERRFIYLREMEVFRVSIPRPDLSMWHKDFPTEKEARAAIEEIKNRAGGDWKCNETRDGRQSSPPP